MANKRVVFERVHGAGLQFSIVKVNDVPLEFVNDKCSRLLPLGEAFEIYWRIQGNAGSKLTVKYSVDGTERTAFESQIPENSSRETAFKFLTL